MTFICDTLVMRKDHPPYTLASPAAIFSRIVIGRRPSLREAAPLTCEAEGGQVMPLCVVRSHTTALDGDGLTLLPRRCTSIPAQLLSMPTSASHNIAR